MAVESAAPLIKSKTPAPAPAKPPKKPKENPYLNLLQPWRKQQVALLETGAALAAQLFTMPDANALVMGDDDASLDQLSLSLKLAAHAQGLQLVHIYEPEQLRCSAPWIKREGHRGLIQPGPGNALYRQLAGGEPLVLLVDFRNFPPAATIQNNTLFDSPPSVDGVPLHSGAKVIGLVNPNHPEAYLGGDFIGRARRIMSLPPEMSFEPNPFVDAIPRADDGLANADVFTIDFFNRSNWEAAVKGTWQIDGQTLIFKEGLLKEALYLGKTICLKNCPWHDQGFQIFWQQVFLTRKIDFGDEIIDLPAGLQFVQSRGYDWSSLTRALCLLSAPDQDGLILNPSLLPYYADQYHCNNESQEISLTPGILAHYHDRALSVQVSRAMTLDDWAWFLDLCQSHRVKLRIHASPQLLPAPLLGLPMNQPAAFWCPPNQIHTIQTTDPWVVMHQLKPDFAVNISEVEPGDLLDKLIGRYSPESRRFIFRQLSGWLNEPEMQGKHVLLYGQFSNRLIDLLVEYTHYPRAFRLTLVANGPLNIPAAIQSQTLIQGQERTHCLLELGFAAPEIEQLSDLERTANLAQQVASLSARRAGQDSAWQGVEKIAVLPPPSPGQGDADQLAAEFEQHRLSAFERYLACYPFVFLTGLTGVGKTAFVEQFKSSSRWFKGEENLAAWARTRPQEGQYALLFIDEVNTSPKQFSFLDGLFCSPPFVLIGAEYFPLTAQHKLVFAGNPLNYGDRQLASFFKDHGGALQFDPMPAAYIEVKILRPLFPDTMDAQAVQSCCRIILSYYDYLNQLAVDEVLISPRELQQIVLLGLANQDKFPACHPAEIFRFYSHLICKTLVPEAHRADFNRRFPAPNLVRVHRPLVLSERFCLTASRAPFYDLLHDMLDLRRFRRASLAGSPLSAAGLNGLIFEGMPGCGKSELLMSGLSLAGYQRVDKVDEQSPEQVYVVIPASMGSDQKRERLCNAFEYGAIVVQEEGNSAFSFERLLNDLLMGKHPQGLLPKQPGFLYLQTQNPSEKFAGRVKMSNALARRTLKIDIPPYNGQDVFEILQYRGIDKSTARQLAAAYVHNEKLAISEKKDPPNLRDVLQLVEKIPPKLPEKRNREKEEPDLSGEMKRLKL